MRYSDGYDMTQVMGIGSYVGELRQGPDGGVYQWVEGIDGLGNLAGRWRRRRAARRARRKRIFNRVKRVTRRVVKKALPVASGVTALLPFPGARAVSAGLRVATPLLRRAGVAGYDGLGALYEMPDGSLYQMQGLADDYLANDYEMAGLADGACAGLSNDDLTEIMGIGEIGELSLGPNNYLYEWEEGIDGLGNVVGRWRPRKRLLAKLRRVRRGARRAVRQARQAARQASKAVLKEATGQIPTPTARRLARRTLRRAGISGYAGLADGGIGALYAADDGTVYQIQGLADYDDMEGLAEDDDYGMEGLADYDDMDGLAEDDDCGMEGLADYDDMEGLADYDDMEGLAEDDDDYDMEGYVPHSGTKLYGIADDMEGYVPHLPPTTPTFQNQTPATWRSPW
ncbi:MAG: hypothetical protein AAGC93_20295 [Cyanobacteria bacterium P01_F01_bin.53]